MLKKLTILLFFGLFFWGGIYVEKNGFLSSEASPLEVIQPKTMAAKQLEPASGPIFGPKVPDSPLVYAQFGKAPTVKNGESGLKFQCRGLDLKGFDSKLNYSCSPKVMRTQNYISLGKRQLNEWEIPRSPKVLVWEQKIPAGGILSVELQDEGGVPWPSTVVSKKSHTSLLTYISPTAQLPKNSRFFLSAKLSSKEHGLENSWLLPLSVLKSGAGKKAPWLIKKKVKRKARKKKRKVRKKTRAKKKSPKKGP